MQDSKNVDGPFVQTHTVLCSCFFLGQAYPLVVFFRNRACPTLSSLARAFVKLSLTVSEFFRSPFQPQKNKRPTGRPYFKFCFVSFICLWKKSLLRVMSNPTFHEKVFLGSAKSDPCKLSPQSYIISQPKFLLFRTHGFAGFLVDWHLMVLKMS